MKPKMYEILARAVEEGVRYGIARSYKHEEVPSKETIEGQVELAVMNAICEVFSFEEEP